MDDDDLAAEQRRAEAAQWFARLKTLPVSHGTLRDFFAWRRQKPNAEAFEQAERFWTEAGKVGERPSILRAVQAATARRVVRRRINRWMLVPALTVAIVASVAAGLWLLKPPTYRTGVGEVRAIALDDGSRVRLNTGTDVSVRYDLKARRLVLREGEALFTVAHGDRRPFIVDAGQATITATGTRFDVTRLGASVSVTLVEGRVVVRTPDGRTSEMRAGEQWQWQPRGSRLRAVNAGNVIAWTQGRLVFDDVSLASAIDEVNRYGSAPVLLDTPAIGAERISGSFETGDSASFATAIAAFLPIEQHRDRSGRIHLVMAKENMEKNTIPR